MADGMSVIERAARAMYEIQGNAIPWDSETLGDWRRDYEREKAKAALEAVNYHGAVAEIEKTARETCHCDLEAGPCSVCRARGYIVAHSGGQ